MTIVWMLLIALFGFGALYFTFYVWGWLYVSRTDELNILHKYQKLYIWGPIALKKLETIYSKQLEDCVTAEDAEKISKALERRTSFLDLYVRANQKWEKLALEEMTKEFEDARGNERKLLALLEEIAHHILLPVRELEAQVLVALRPFTEKRILRATTVRELVDLKVGQGAKVVWQSDDMFSLGYEVSRIDDSIKGLYLSTLVQLILKDVIKASTFEDTKSLCFKIPTGASVLDELILLKKSLLAPSVTSRPELAKALSNVNFELRLLLS